MKFSSKESQEEYFGVKIPQRVNAKFLTVVAQCVRAKIQPDFAENGDCEPVSDAIAKELMELGFYNAHTTGFTSFKGHPHVWVVVDGWYVDATHDQFRHYAKNREEEEYYLDTPVVVGHGKGPPVK